MGAVAFRRAAGRRPSARAPAGRAVASRAGGLDSFSARGTADATLKAGSDVAQRAGATAQGAVDVAVQAGAHAADHAQGN
ncbi:hypothetical protein NK326_24785, partial [Salmonella enterica]|nr:hypothetical protein [Salmonella enterica]